MDLAHLPLFEQVDVIQVGARNMQNFELLKELGKIDKPILLKRGLANNIKELLMSADIVDIDPGTVGREAARGVLLGER